MGNIAACVMENRNQSDFQGFFQDTDDFNNFEIKSDPPPAGNAGFFFPQDDFSKMGSNDNSSNQSFKGFFSD